MQKKCLPGRHASCLDRLWREAHPDGIFNETYTEPAIALAGRAGGTKTKPGQTKTSLAAIDMINASFHDTNVSIHKPRKARVAKSAAANEETARWNPSLFGDVGVGTVGAGVGGTVGVVAARTKTSRKGKGKGKQKPTRVSPRKHTQTQNPPAGEFTSLLFGRLEDTRDASLGFGGVGGVTHSSPPVSPPAAAALSEAAEICQDLEELASFKGPMTRKNLKQRAAPHPHQRCSVRKGGDSGTALGISQIQRLFAHTILTLFFYNTGQRQRRRRRRFQGRVGFREKEKGWKTDAGGDVRGEGAGGPGRSGGA